MPYARPTLNEIIDRIVTDIATRVEGANGSVLRRSLFGVLARAEGGTAHLLYGYIDWVAKQAIPDTAEDEYLVRWARIWGLSRKLATFSTGNVTMTGNIGSKIDADAVLQSQLGAQYRVTKTTAFTATSQSVPVRALTAGTEQDLEAGAKLALVSPVPGVNTVGTVAAGGITGGTNIETIDALRARLLKRIQNTPQGGSKADYLLWALEVPGVTRAWVYPLQMGAGTVTVLAASDNGDTPPIPSAATIAALQEHLDEEAPVTATVYAAAPNSQPLNPVIALAPNTPAVQAAVKAELEYLLLREAEPGGKLLLSHIREAISIAAGETDSRVISPTDDVQPPTGSLLTLGTVTFQGIS